MTGYLSKYIVSFWGRLEEGGSEEDEMNEQLVGYIGSIVAGLITNGIQGIFNYITKETLQDRIACVIESVQKLYEQEYGYRDDSLFVWEENIEYYTRWLAEGFLPRENEAPPLLHGCDPERGVSQEEVGFISREMGRLVKEDAELRSLHASIVCDEIYRMLAGKENSEKNKDYYAYVKSFGSVLFLHKTEDKKAITLQDTYVKPGYDIPAASVALEDGGIADIEAVLAGFAADSRNRVMIVEGDAGVGKSSLVSYLVFQNEKKLLKSGEGIFGSRCVFCIRLRNLTMNRAFMDAPVQGMVEELGFRTYEEFAEAAGKAVLLLDGFDELCMMDGMADFAEQVLGEAIRGFGGCHIIITTRPKFLSIRKLKEEGIDGIAYIVLKHFDLKKREEWIEKYRKVCDSEELPRLERIMEIEEDASNGICDTPMALYMLAAGRITDEAWDNPWVLYHQIFRMELSNAEYNRLFAGSVYSHAIGRYGEILYRVSAEIAYRMYLTGNKQLYVNEKDIEEIVCGLQLDAKQALGQIVRRCYALCNYWKNDEHKGISEFYHNNIRDFFLCEKIFYELEEVYKSFDPACLRDDRMREDTIAKFISRFGCLFSNSSLNDKVSEFIYYRSLNKMLHGNEDAFMQKEMKYQFLGYFFEKMFVNGAISSYQYDGRRSLHQENMNVLQCTVQIYRHIYEPYVFCGKKRLEWFFNAGSEMNDMEGLPYLFKPVFIRTPLTISSSYSIPVAGYADFNLFDMKSADLRYGMFNHSKFLSCNFSDTILVSTDFSGAVLRNCRFTNADFRHSSLAGADITGSSFENCSLSGTTLPDGLCSDVEEEQRDLLTALLQRREEGG